MVWLSGSTAGCGGPEARAEKAAPRVVDSLLSRDELLTKFREGLPPADRLGNGSESRDQLVKRFLSALETRDTADLAAMAITRSEFGYLYYPATPQGLPPYELDPGLMWHMLIQRSDRGMRRALDLYGGRRLRLIGYQCGEGASQEGENTIWGPCLVRCRGEEGRLFSLWLFSQIVERDGRYKFLSYANKL